MIHTSRCLLLYLSITVHLLAKTKHLLESSPTQPLRLIISSLLCLSLVDCPTSKAFTHQEFMFSILLNLITESSCLSTRSQDTKFYHFPSYYKISWIVHQNLSCQQSCLGPMQVGSSPLQHSD